MTVQITVKHQKGIVVSKERHKMTATAMIKNNP
jgi:hypothetical protein